MDCGRRGKTSGESEKMNDRAERTPANDRRRRTNQVSVLCPVKKGQGEGEESPAEPWKYGSVRVTVLTRSIKRY
jgi:hypothetical protein